MRIGFFADVHANLEALEACTADFKKERLKKVFFLGDAVGYGPDPNKCVELIDKKADIRILGNHDAVAIGLLSSCYFNQYAQISMGYTCQVLSEKNLSRLRGSVMEATFQIFKMLHASPREPSGWGYVLDLEDAEENFKYFEQQVCMIAHSHRPAIIRKFGTNRCQAVEHDFVHIDDDYRYIINVGSVGQPRDGDHRSCYMIWDAQTNIVSTKRVDYDYAKTQEKMMRANLPRFLVERIAAGK